jgi:hypothetical protein
MRSRQEYIKGIKGIEAQQKGEVFSPAMVEKLIGYPARWKTLKKAELARLLTAWQELMAQCPHTDRWQRVEWGDRAVSLSAAGRRWVDYFGFATRGEARAFLTKILPHCRWAMIRPSGKRLNASFECKVWGLSDAELNRMVREEEVKKAAIARQLYEAIARQLSHSLIQR